MGVGMKRTGGKYVTDLGGHRWPMDSILKAVRQAGGCRALVHKRGWVDLGETAAARLPDDRYRHCRSKHADWAVRHVVGTVAAMPAQDRKRLRATWVDQRTADQGAGLLEEAGVAQCMVDLLDAAEAQVPAAQATFEAAAQDPWDYEAVLFQFKLDEQPWGAWQKENGLLSPLLGEGEHVLRVRVLYG